MPEFSGDIALEHLHRYYVAREFSKGKQVLDIACGEGYGSAILAESALGVIGIDASTEVIEYAREHYPQQNIKFIPGVCNSIPLSDASVDLIVCFETIEHHADHHEMMREFVRVLRPDGVAIISTPDKAEYSDKPKFVNPFHVKELYFDEFKELMLNYFPNTRFYGQRVRYGSFVGPLDSKPTIAANYRLLKGRTHKSISVPEPIFILAVASNGKLKDLPSGVFVPEIPEYSQHISALQTELNNREQLVGKLNRQIAESEKRLGLLKHQIVENGGQVAYLNQQVAERDVHLVELNQQIVERDARILVLSQKVTEGADQLASLQQQVTVRDTQVLQLNQQITERDAQLAQQYYEVTSRDTNLNILHQLLVERTGQWDLLRQLVADRDAQLAALKQQAHDYDGLLKSIVASKSWRVTSPLRMVAQAWRRARHAMGILPTVISGNGGMMNAANKAMAAYRQDGLAGVRNGLRNKISRTGIITGQPHDQSDLGLPDRNGYSDWVSRYDSMNEDTRLSIRQHITKMPHTPLFSILMPTYNTEPEWLIEAIESVRKQLYPHWELCIADDASEDKNIRPILEGYLNEDPRIKVLFREKNGHISAASNDALTLATGEWVALLDHDDLLPEHALFWIADAINQHPHLRLIYSDEDKVDDKGRRFQPYFKCDWNVDLFYSHNLITHLGVYRADLVHKVGGFREGFEGAQDYDLALRIVEHIEHHQIHHIPRVLYHWRVHNKSTAQSLGAKPYALPAGEKAINEHLKRQGAKAKAELVAHGYRVSYALPDSPPKVSLIVPTRNELPLIRQCVDSILKKTLYPNYELLIVDNGSDDPETLRYFESLTQDTRIRVLRDDRPFNFSALNNAAVKKAHGTVVGLVNNDISVISPEWLTEMVSLAIQPKVGAVGARLWYTNDTLQHGGVILGIGGVAGHSHKSFPKGHSGYFSRMSLISGFSAITAACLIIKKSLYEDLGGFNETDLAIAFNDIDFCLRVREAGYRNIWTPYADLYHQESASRGLEDVPEKQARFANEVQYMKQRWKDSLLEDPAYSPNLTLDHEDFSLAWPPRVKNLPALSTSHPKECLADTDLSRLDKVMSKIDKAGQGLEIGPSFNPLAPKRQGFHVHILDHMSTEELREKYQGHGINLDDIEEVDFVWKGEPLHELIGHEQYYDWIIASHVIEHTPDLISFLADCERLLKPTGILSLVIPDKRYCFDYFHSTTSTGELLDAFEQKTNRPSPGKVFDHFSRAAKCDGQIAWSPDIQGALEFVHNLSVSSSHWKLARTTGTYIDVHNWRFTPSSFRLLLGDLRTLGLTIFDIKDSFDTAGCEFFVTLGKNPNVSCLERTNRMELLEKLIAEERSSI